jgi:N-methylhydantoinase B/oxoprolinase/acetone carboxylase alpha subunit
MKEIIAGTKEGNRLVNEMISEVKFSKFEEAIEEEINMKKEEARQRSISELDDIMNELYDGLGD